MPVLNNKQSIVSYWEKVQDGIYEAFKDLGADPNAKDACRYLRNPYQPNAVNTKYPDRPCVELKYVGEKTTLKDLYEPLKKSGFIKLKGTHREQKSPGERDKVPFRVSMGRLVNFLKENPNWEGTHKELFAMLDIAERTGCQLLKWLKERELKVERVRVGRTWKSRFYANFDTASISKQILHDRKQASCSLYSMALKGFGDRGFSQGCRNDGVFVLSLWLKICGHSESGALGLLEGGFLKTFSSGHAFDRGEYERTVRSAFRGRYKFCHSYQSRRFQKMLIDLVLDNLQCEKIPKTHNFLKNLLDKTYGVMSLPDGFSKSEYPIEADIQLARIREKNIATFGKA